MKLSTSFFELSPCFTGKFKFFATKIVYTSAQMFRIILLNLIFFSLASCSGFTAASVSTNVAAYSTTGKTGTDHVISYLSGKDCKVFRVAVNQEICKSDNSALAFNTKIKEDKTTFIDSVTDATVYLTKSIAKDHAILGAKITDKIGLTKQLGKKIEAKFNSALSEEKQNIKEEKIEAKFNSALAEEKQNIKEEKIGEKKSYKKRPWEARVETAEEERKKFKQKFLKTFKKIKIYTFKTNSKKATQKTL